MKKFKVTRDIPGGAASFAVPAGAIVYETKMTRESTDRSWSQGYSLDTTCLRASASSLGLKPRHRASRDWANFEFVSIPNDAFVPVE